MKYIFLILSVFTVVMISCKKQMPQNAVQTERNERIKKIKENVDKLNKEKEWKLIKDNLYISKNGDLGFKTMEATEEGIFIDRYLTHVFVDDFVLMNNVIDSKTFEFLGSSFYKDKNHIYSHFVMADGGTFSVVEDADINTFQVIGDCYAKDKNYIFGEKALLMDYVDYKTFKTKKGIGCYSSDKTGYYFWDKKLNMNELDEYAQKAIEQLKQ